ncbi:alkaline phosphatase D family protein [Sorangium sp. So ce341]|uniref:alkaline phosphatase D family protein n=1 Tax=Sorangium sp. So ce341 TaxID=3133302 RepID=UPI003F647827
MMRRRDFLRATLVTAGAVVVPTACSEDEGVAGACDAHEDDAYFPQSVASGDPRPDSVVLWTRLVDSQQTADVSLALVIALDEAFTQLVTLTPTSSSAATVGSTSTRLSVIARAEFDHCVKVKVSGLSPGTTYYYRFYYTTGDGCVSSRVGRTRTAPAPDADVPVRFAFVSCQDYVGRYYNAYAALAREQLDFVVHLGDYIYETTGDPSIQTPSEERKVTFSDVNGAIAFEPAEGAPYYAARSLSNYRELYKTYRSDRALQRVHELFPMIAIWGDHEFSSECYGATATYFNGRQPETDVDRRKAANQAWFEYMPVDYPAGDDFSYDRTADYPQDITIYRDFTFGKHVHLVMTDLRTYRADHLIPEDGFPGKVIARQAELVAQLGSLPEHAGNYIEDIDNHEQGLYATALEEAAPLLGFDPSLGFAQDESPRTVNASFVNAVVAKLNEQRPAEEQLPLITRMEFAGMDFGIAYVDLGKHVDFTLEKPDFYSAFGSRYFVVKETFDAASRFAYDPSTGSDAMVMGEAQLAWFKDTIKESKSTWKVWGNEYCLSQLAIDLTPSRAEDDPLKRRFYLSCDGWDGFREQRNALLSEIATAGNVVAITGDLGAFLAGTPAVDRADAEPAKIVEFVGAAISSATYQSRLQRQIASHPLLKHAMGAESIAVDIDNYLVEKGVPAPTNPYLAFSNASSNGFCIAEANADEFVVSMHMLPADALAKPLYEEADAATLDGQITIARFKTTGGADLHREEEGTWKKWSPATAGEGS